ncbi:hypothetical protein H5410_004075 [Solanum commersonii]|uniref:Uncharacterized protein n=1 Tax=Solanum commersonii TaxID=4109 RepID=A0A9J6B6L8_SOLCO|nr:hypothetical protein H5410_004075 [Solanum commersonii]
MIGMWHGYLRCETPYQPYLKERINQFGSYISKKCSQLNLAKSCYWRMNVNKSVSMEDKKPIKSSMFCVSRHAGSTSVPMGWSMRLNRERKQPLRNNGHFS